MADELTLTPEYRFEWSDGTVRLTSEDDVLADDTEWTPDSVEALAALGRADPDCTVELLGMGS